MTFEHSARAAEREVIQLTKRIWVLEELLRECAEELAPIYDNHYPYRNKYPNQMRRYNRDMDIVYRARKALEDTDSE